MQAIPTVIMASPPRSFIRPKTLFYWTIVIATTLSMSACVVGPDYVVPKMDLPRAYKEQGPWKIAEPGQIDSRQPWWEAYHDGILNELIEQANQANQNIRLAQAQYRQAQAAAALARASLWPGLSASGGPSRAQTNSYGTQHLVSTDALGLSASWEPDIWGAVQRSVQAGDASSQASAATLAAARLSIQATLAQDYLQLRVTDLQKDLYQRTVTAYTRSLVLTQQQYAAGVALLTDVAQAQTQLLSTQAQLIDLDATRNQLEHAIAILIGKAPSSFSLAPLHSDAASLLASMPVIPTGLPSALLERRPDIANAERLAAVANANIGVARSAYFPSLTLSATGGYSGLSYGQMFDVPSRVWSLGASLAATLFDGGARDARTAQANAAFDAAVATYKQTVLGGLQEVEDNLSTLRVLDQESQAQERAVQAARLSEQLALSQYQAGTVTYVTVVNAQATTLNNERTAAQLLGRQLVASVALIKATGGGWHASEMTHTDMATAKPVVAATASH